MAWISRQIDVTDLPLSEGKNVVSVTAMSAGLDESESGSVVITPQGEFTWRKSEDGTYYICTGIGEFALPNITIPPVFDGLPVKEIGEFAFSLDNATPGTDAYSRLYNLHSVTIPHTVEKIGWGAFKGTPYLRYVTFDSSTKYNRIWFLDGFLMEDFRYYYETEDGETNGPWPGKQLEFAGTHPFGSSLYTALIPKNTCTLKFSGITSYVTGRPSRIESDNVMDLHWEPYGHFGWSRKTTNPEDGIYVAKIYEASIESMMNDYLASIGEETETPLTIDTGAFMNCKFLATLSMPDRLKTIGDSAFQGCEGLKFVLFPPTSRLESIGMGAFENCKILEKFSVGWPLSKEGQFPYHLTNIGATAFRNTGLLCISIGSSSNSVVPVYESITIGGSAFANCTQLYKATLSGCSMNELSQRLFSGCTSLCMVALPVSLKRISKEAFAGCSRLTSAYGSLDRIILNIPNTVEEIEPNAFFGCDTLDYIRLEDGAGWFYTDQDTHSYEHPISREITSSQTNTAEVFKAHAGWTFFKLDQMVAPEILVTNNILSIIDITGIAEEFKIYVDGTHRATLDIEANELTFV